MLKSQTVAEVVLLDPEEGMLSEAASLIRGGRIPWGHPPRTWACRQGGTETCQGNRRRARDPCRLSSAPQSVPHFREPLARRHSSICRVGRTRLRLLGDMASDSS